MFAAEPNMIANDTYNIASSDPGSHFLMGIQAEDSKSTGIYDVINECKWYKFCSKNMCFHATKMVHGDMWK